MALRQFVALHTDQSTCKSILIDTVTGKKVFDFMPFGQDFGHHWWKFSDGSVIEVDYDASNVQKYSPEFELLWEKSYFADNSGNFRQSAPNLNGTELFFQDANSSQTIKKFIIGGPPRQELQNGPTLVPQPTTTISALAIGQCGDKEVIFIVSLDERRVWIATTDGLNSSSFSYDALETSWGLSPSSLRISAVNVVGNKVVFTTRNYVVADGPAFFILPIPSTFVDLQTSIENFTGGQSVVVSTTQSLDIVGTTDAGSFLQDANYVYFGVSGADAKQFCALNVNTGAIERAIFSTNAPTYDVGNVHYADLQLSVGWVRLANGHFLCLFKRYPNWTEDQTTYARCLVELDANLDFVRDVFIKTSEYGNPTIAMYGIELLTFDTYHVSGTVTQNGSPVENATVGWISANGKMTWKTTTASNGTYTLPVIGSGVKKIGAIVGNAMRVHMVTPT